MFPRYLTEPILGSLNESRVTLLVGARQSGKSTLVQNLVPAAPYLTLDDATALSAASADPSGFLAGLGRPAIIDEVQRVPDLLLAIKTEVDRSQSPGQFVLTGSANVLFLPQVADSLAGRMEHFTLWPLSQGELHGMQEGFLTHVFEGTRQPQVQPEGRDDLIERLFRGGYPEVVRRGSLRAREAWLRSYVTAVIQRDVRDLSNIRQLNELPRLLALLAARAPGTLNIAGLSRDIGLPARTIERYLALLEHVFIVRRLPAWTRNIGRRQVKAPKVLINDSALMAQLQALTPARIQTWDQSLVGGLLENFVAMELTKQASWSAVAPSLFHYRTADGNEVDIVLEDRRGRVVGVEVKSAISVGAGDFRGLRELARLLGDRFVRGVVLHPGRAIVPFSEKLAAWPVQTLWSR